LIVDASLVRVLLVPALMRLLGRLNWRAPGPLARIHGRYGVTDAREISPGAQHQRRQPTELS